MAAPVLKYMTPEEYLAIERTSKEKHEYFEGEIMSMAGASLPHNDIVANLLREIGYFLKGKPCRILPSDIRISVSSRESYMYPDATILCGEPSMEDGQFDTLKNPSVIFEVLSPSSEDHDRGKKFFFYRQIPSFKEYILIDTTTYFVEISRRQPDNSWKFDTVSGPDSSFFISTIDYNFPLKELYKNVLNK